jgi:AcrR family transcriptional regulator
MIPHDWLQTQAYILQLEKEGLVTRTFRRLDPDRQQAVLTAILDEAVDRGPTSINIKQVARRAGISVGSLYTYFENRDGLLTFAVELCIRLMRDIFGYARQYLLAMPIREALRGYMAGGFELGEAQAGMMQFFVRAAYNIDSELSEQVVRPIAEVMRDLVRDMLAEAIKRGEVRDDIDIEATARIIHAMTLVVPVLNVYFQVVGDDVTVPRSLEAFIDLIMAGIGTETGKA